MSGRVAARLDELGIELPKPSTPGGNFLAVKQVGSLVYVAGQIPWWNGEKKYVGKVGKDFTLAEGQAAARLCALNIVAHVKAHLKGDLDRVTACVRLGGFVNSGEGFLQQPLVVNGASDTIVEIFGDVGRHVRTAIGAGILPGNVAVEVDAIFEVK